MTGSGVAELQIGQFLLIYLLLLVVGAIMTACKINQTKLLVVASIRMSVQLVLCGLVLTYIFKNPHPLFVVAYVALMMGFTIYRVISKNRQINTTFKLIVAFSACLAGALTLCYFVIVVVRRSVFDPQYAIPIAGMIMGNTMTGMTLGVKTFRESLDGQRAKIAALQGIGASPKAILLPFVRQAFASAFLPTLNSMLGMGIVALPGMMTGQILSGTLPMTAILYQIAAMVAICTSVCLSSFLTLYLGYRTLVRGHEQLIDLAAAGVGVGGSTGSSKKLGKRQAKSSRA